MSVEVLNRAQPINAGDIVVSNLMQIEQLLLVYGKVHSERTHSTINFIFYQSTMVGMTLFYYNWFCAFSASSMHDSVILLVANYFLVLPNIIVYAT